MTRLLAAIVIATILSAPAVAENVALKGDVLREAISGKTVYISSPLGEVPIRYAANGSMSGKTELALLDGETTARDNGRWWIAGDRLCIKWQRWMNARQYCFAMHRAGGTTVRWIRDDGKIGMARLG